MGLGHFAYPLEVHRERVWDRGIAERLRDERVLPRDVLRVAQLVHAPELHAVRDLRDTRGDVVVEVVRDGTVGDGLDTGGSVKVNRF